MMATRGIEFRPWGSLMQFVLRHALSEEIICHEVNPNLVFATEAEVAELAKILDAVWSKHKRRLNNGKILKRKAQLNVHG